MVRGKGAQVALAVGLLALTAGVWPTAAEAQYSYFSRPSYSQSYFWGDVPRTRRVYEYDRPARPKKSRKVRVERQIRPQPETTTTVTIPETTPAAAPPQVTIAAPDTKPAVAAPETTATITPPAETRAPVTRQQRPPKPDSKSAKLVPLLPPGPLHIVISIDAQRASLYAGGTLVRQSSISSGTPEYPTPMGVFSILQKNRHHVSNIYHVPMPFMQRITWSGIALHQGPLPGYPASHGCIRLPLDFAELLWKTTRIGARVIVARPETAPVEIAHPRLAAFAPKPALDSPVADQPADRRAEMILIRTAQSIGPGNVVIDAPKVFDGNGGTTPPVRSDAKGAAGSLNATKPNEGVTLTSPPPPAAPVQAARRPGPVSVLVSRKDGKLYVRQAAEPLFDTPITIRDAHEPFGTHVFTAMELAKDGADTRWTVVSIPSTYPRDTQPTTRNDRNERKQRKGRPVQTAVVYPPLPGAGAVLDRIEIPQEVVDRIAPLLTAGASLIISDNGISGETGRGTDFIVLTR